MGFFGGSNKPRHGLSREQQGRLEHGGAMLTAAQKIAAEHMGGARFDAPMVETSPGALATALRKAYVAGYARGGGEARHTSYDEIAAVSAKIMRAFRLPDSPTAKVRIPGEQLKRILFAGFDVANKQAKDPALRELKQGPPTKKPHAPGQPQPGKPQGPGRAPAQPHATQMGPRGGQYYTGAGGQKVYVGSDGKKYTPIGAR